jgi:hypothetical protein
MIVGTNFEDKERSPGSCEHADREGEFRKHTQRII